MPLLADFLRQTQNLGLVFGIGGRNGNSEITNRRTDGISQFLKFDARETVVGHDVRFINIRPNGRDVRKRCVVVVHALIENKGVSDRYHKKDNPE